MVAAVRCHVTTCDPQSSCVSLCLPGGTSLSFLVLVTGCTSAGRIPEAKIYKITATDFTLSRKRPRRRTAEPCGRSSTQGSSTLLAQRRVLLRTTVRALYRRT